MIHLNRYYSQNTARNRAVFEFILFLLFVPGRLCDGAGARDGIPPGLPFLPGVHRPGPLPKWLHRSIG